MNSRTKLLLLASAAAAALACASCGGSQEIETADTAAALVAAPAAQLLAPEDPAPAPEAARRAFTPVVAPGEGIEIAEESITGKNEKHKYKIEISFPQLKGRLIPSAAKFNRAVRALAAREARDFRNAYAGQTRQPATQSELWKDFYESLSGRYEFIHFADDLISLRFTFYGRGRGAAHAVQFHRVLNFDLKSGRPLKLNDLFRPEARHLHALAAYSIAELKKQDEEEHRSEVARLTAEGRPASHAGIRTPESEFQSGAGPQVENYRAWNLAAEGVVITFAACQVSGCAAGEQEVFVPYYALAEILHEAGPAARLYAPQPR